MDNLSLIETGITLKNIKDKLYKAVCDVACKTIQEVLKNLDRKLMKERDSKVYRTKDTNRTCIKIIMGNMEFKRRIYKFKIADGKSGFKFLLDEQLQIDTIGN